MFQHFILPTMDRIFPSGGNTNRMAGAILQNNENILRMFPFMLRLIPRVHVCCMSVEVDVFWTHMFFLVMFVTNLFG